MATLHWERITAGAWRLVDGDAQVWALVDRYIDERTGEAAKGGGRGIFAKPRFKVTHPKIEYPQTRDGAHWSLASTVAGAKRDAEGHLHRNRCAYEDFTITDESIEPAFIPTLAGLRAIGVAA